jgi:hypothetical protein
MGYKAAIDAGFHFAKKALQEIQRTGITPE